MDQETEHRDELWVAIPPEEIDRQSVGPLSERRAHLWSLVLEARYLKSRVEPDAREWRLLVPDHQLQQAQRELRLFVEENRHWPPPPPQEAASVQNTLPTISVLILLATFHNVTRLDLELMGSHPIPWTESGAAQASLILHGEWWRLVTSLTLHADALHLISNLAFGSIFIIYLCRDLGSGLAWTFLIGAGALGNLANAWVQLPSHSSIGFSTVVFAAVGILGAVNMLRYRHFLQRRWPLPIAASLSLLALLGSEGKQTDLGAHLFGFIFGVVFGVIAERLTARWGRPQGWMNRFLAAATALAVLASWWKALV